MDQSTFLARFKSNTAVYTPTFHQAEVAAWLSDFQARLPAQRAALSKQFGDALTTAGGNFYRVNDAEDAIAMTLKLAQARGVKSVTAWQHPLIEATCAALRGAGISITTSVLDGTTREALRAAGASADLGLTSCDYALAETGTLLLVGNAQQGRLTSLLPITHIAIITPQQLVPTFADAIKLLRHARLTSADGRLPSNISLHTGPSKTGDIEQTITKGVHGPKEVHVILQEN